MQMIMKRRMNVLGGTDVGLDSVNEDLATTSRSISPKQRDFSILKKVHDSMLLVDKENSICVLRWKGRIDLETASELLTLGAAATMLNGYKKMLIDRRSLIEFDNEARIWIDNWIKNKARTISLKDGKIAIINSEGVLAHIFNNVFNSTISMVFPHLKLRKFDNATRAIEWLTTEKSK